MASEWRNKLATLSVPKLNGFVEGGWSEVATIRRVLNLYNKSLMTSKPLYWFVLSLWLPHHHSIVIGARNKLLSFRVSNFVISFLSVGFHFYLVSFELQMLASMVIASSLQNEVWTKGQSIYPMSVAFEIIQQDSLFCIPALNSSVLRGCINHALTAPKHFCNRGCVASKDFDAWLRSSVPNSSLSIFRRWSHKSCVSLLRDHWLPCDTGYKFSMSFKRFADLLSRFRIP